MVYMIDPFRQLTGHGKRNGDLLLHEGRNIPGFRDGTFGICWAKIWSIPLTRMSGLSRRTGCSPNESIDKAGSCGAGRRKVCELDPEDRRGADPSGPRSHLHLRVLQLGFLHLDRRMPDLKFLFDFVNRFLKNRLAIAFVFHQKMTTQ